MPAGNALDCDSNDLLREVIRADITADSERVAACELDLVDDKLCLLLVKAAVGDNHVAKCRVATSIRALD